MLHPISVSGSVSTVPADAVFAKEANSVKINSISNSGDPLTNINVALYASDVSGGTVPINTTTIASLASGGTATVTLVDPTIRSSEGGTVTYTAVVDPDNLISETNEGNNNKSSSAESVKYNGYKGKRYTDGNDITTQATFEGKYGLVYSAGNTAYNGAYWAAQTYSWSSTDLPIPAGATVVSVRLYQPYTWNYLTTDPAFIMSFNGNSVNPIATYKDKKNYGTYAELPSGLYVYNVTSLFNPSGNTITITPEDGNNYGMWGAYMVVVYQDPAGKTEKIWINDEFDNLYAGASYAVTSDEATTYAPFSGVSTSGVSKATSIAILASANEVGKSKFYFNNQEYSGFWADYLSTPQIGFSSYNVTGAIQEGTDTASLQSYISGSSGDNMYAINSILVVEYSATAPVANFTANVTSGTAPLTVQFTDQSTGSPTSWLWDFGDGTTATGQNSSHTYSTAGTYNVNLTVTGPGGSDSEVKTGYIVVSNTAAPVANFNVVLDGDGKMPHGLAPITVSFTDASIGTVDTYKWEYRIADNVTWTTFGSGAQNPTNIMFSDAGTYDIRLTVTNSGGSSNKTIAHAFAAGKLHDYLTTINSGIVSGDLYVNSQSPAITTKTCSYTLPASGSNISWARVFVDVYSGSGDNNWPVGITTELDPTGSGSWSTLGVEKGDIQSESNTASPDGQPYVYPVNDHMTKVYSDYEVWYDVTDLLTSTPRRSA